MLKIEIDGKELEVSPGTTIIQAADAAGIYIPRFCYHKKLTVAANCRMCLVEVEKMGKPQPACATPVGDGMKVLTKSIKALQAQKAVMEFLLINHPLDCPICDQGGQCELQDLAMGFGADVSMYQEGKRAVVDPDLGPLVATDMTRCIQCTRCVRFGDEIASVREIGGMNRGEHLSITTYVKHTLQSELSGNIIDICPVGALTSKPFRFKARAWELQQMSTVPPHDCLGSPVYVGVLRNELLRVSPRECEEINEVWLSDRDRFSYAGLHSPFRAKQPMIKQNGVWQKVDWSTAFDFTVNHLRRILADDPLSVGFLANPSATLEELYLFQKLARALGVRHIDHRLRQTDFSLESMKAPGLGISLPKLAKQKGIFLIGSYVEKDQPILGLRVREAIKAGGKVAALNCIDHRFHFDLTSRIVTQPSDMVYALGEIVKAAALLKGVGDLPSLLADLSVRDEAEKIAKMLCDESSSASIILGNFALSHKDSSTLQALAVKLASITGATVGSVSFGANSAGAYLAGVLPDRNAMGQKVESGFSVQQMWQQGLKSYVLLGVEPDLDCANSGKAMRAIKQADLVVSLSAFVTKEIEEYAHVILPIASMGETSGTFINIAGSWQSFSGAVLPPGEARPAWKVLRALGNLFDLEGFEFNGSDEVLAECRDLPREEVDFSLPLPATLPKKSDARFLERISEVPMYAVDALVRHAEPLQILLKEQRVNAVRMNKATAKRYEATEGRSFIFRQFGQTMNLTVLLDEGVPDNCLFIYEGIKETAGFGETNGLLEV